MKATETVVDHTGTWEIKWISVPADGAWALIHNGETISYHDYKWTARVARWRRRR